ncbi:MAG: Crp/Fnr family transcriptional regulator [Acidimicrobiia bacterium]|nr:Crp/Fnr family transcriptional regulator [Acidimicrobiia bacterium]
MNRATPHEAVHAGWLARCLGNSAAPPLTDDDLAALVDVSRFTTVAAGELLFVRNDPVAEVFVVETGKVALTRPAAGRSPVLQVLHPGDVFGDVGLFLGRSAPVDALVLEDAELLVLDGADLVRLVSTRPAIALRWMVSMARRLADSQDRLEELLAGPLDTQLALLLDHAADRDGSVAASQELLARLLGARRPSVNRSLANLERLGLIEKTYRRIRVVDAERLRALAE